MSFLFVLKPFLQKGSTISYGKFRGIFIIKKALWNYSSSSWSRASPWLDCSRFHKLPPSESILLYPGRAAMPLLSLFRPWLSGWRSASRIRSQVWRGRPGRRGASSLWSARANRRLWRLWAWGHFSLAPTELLVQQKFESFHYSWIPITSAIADEMSGFN